MVEWCGVTVGLEVCYLDGAFELETLEVIGEVLEPGNNFLLVLLAHPTLLALIILLSMLETHLGGP